MRTFPQWWDPEFQRAETIEQVDSEAAFRNQTAEIPIRSRHNPCLRNIRLSGSDRLVLTGFDNVQQPGLTGKRERVDLVQQQCSAPSGFKTSDFGAVGSCESPANVAEKLAFNHVTGQRSAGDTVTFGTVSVRHLVDDSRQVRLSAAGFTDQEDCHIVFCHALKLGQNRTHFRGIRPVAPVPCSHLKS